ncbi:MAG: AAA family ATPase [Planctomycetes bacterium]|nr:AAA family ATPase [Planctomycetota bacterium]
MNELYLKDFRCFNGEHRLPLSPVTLLVGENSTGKTSVLAAVRLALSLGHRILEPDFNEEPFLLGSYNEIANNRGGKWKAKAFELGYGKSNVSIEGTFIEDDGYPRLKEWYFDSRNKPEFRARLIMDKSEVEYSIGDNGNTKEATVKLDSPYRSMRGVDTAHAMSIIESLFSDTKREGLSDRKSQVFPRRFMKEYRFLRGEGWSNLLSIAPVRSKPKRTYNFVSDAYQPEGGHIPEVLAALASDDRKWETIRSKLVEFGKAAGMFSDIEVKRYGSTKSEPFQIQVKVEGKTRNLLDVGYGVSQVLPILVDSLRAPKGTIFLIQQPEVHLHPKAQAALASLLLQIAITDKKQFIIETHSDFIINRIRMDVRDKEGGTNSDSANVLFFERSRSDAVNVHNITFDADGNLDGVPDNYGDFFLHETDRLLGI